MGKKHAETAGAGRLEEIIIPLPQLLPALQMLPAAAAPLLLQLRQLPPEGQRKLQQLLQQEPQGVKLYPLPL